MRTISCFFRGLHGQSLIFHEGKQEQITTEVEGAVSKEGREEQQREKRGKENTGYVVVAGNCRNQTIALKLLL